MFKKRICGSFQPSGQTAFSSLFFDHRHRLDIHFPTTCPFTSALERVIEKLVVLKFLVFRCFLFSDVVIVRRPPNFLEPVAFVMCPCPSSKNRRRSYPRMKCAVEFVMSFPRSREPKRRPRP